MDALSQRGTVMSLVLPGLTLVVWVIWLPVPAEAAAIVTPSVTADVGDTLSIDVSISDAIDLTSWQFDLHFDPTIVQADSVTEGPFMSAFGATLFTPGAIDNVNGTISVIAGFYVDLPPNPARDGVLATIALTLVALGASPLTFSNTFLNLEDDGFAVANGQITVLDSASIAEPASLVLLAGGFVLLSLRQRARRGRHE
jgi:hypothetical protein